MPYSHTHIHIERVIRNLVFVGSIPTRGLTIMLCILFLELLMFYCLFSLPWKLLDLVLLVQDLDLHYYFLSKCKKYFHRCVLLLYNSMNFIFVQNGNTTKGFNTTDSMKNNFNLNFQVNSKANKNITVQKVSDNETTVIVKDIEAGG